MEGCIQLLGGSKGGCAVAEYMCFGLGFRLTGASSSGTDGVQVIVCLLLLLLRLQAFLGVLPDFWVDGELV